MKNDAIKFLQCGGGWATNIGNAFIDYGIRYIIKTTFPNSDIYFTSNTPNALYHRYANKNDFINLPGIIKADYFIFGGSLLDLRFFNSHRRLINDLIKNNSKLILLGVGGSDKFNSEEVESIRKFLKKLNIFMLITRDSETYSNYSDLSEYSYKGIDSGFFLNDYIQPPEISYREYTICTFDKIPIPNLKITGPIIKLHHDNWKFSSNSLFSTWDIKKYIWDILHNQSNIINKSDFISEHPDDYLTFYANANKVYSDRIHACVAALAFGNSAQLYTNSDRSMLFERVGAGLIKQGLVKLDECLINKEKDSELKFLKETL